MKKISTTLKLILLAMLISISASAQPYPESLNENFDSWTTYTWIHVSNAEGFQLNTISTRSSSPNQSIIAVKDGQGFYNAATGARTAATRVFMSLFGDYSTYSVSCMMKCNAARMEVMFNGWPLITPMDLKTNATFQKESFLCEVGTNNSSGYLNINLIDGSLYIDDVKIVRLPSPKTEVPNEITGTSIRMKGYVNYAGVDAITEKGIVYSSINSTPTTADTKVSMGSGTDPFDQVVTGLTPNTTYNMRSYLTCSLGTSYGNTVTIQTPSAPAIPSVTTEGASTKTTSATLSGNVTNENFATVTERGFVYATTTNPTTTNTKVVVGAGLGAFFKEVTGLIEGTTYYVKAYAINSIGTAYGDEKTFVPTKPTPGDALNFDGVDDYINLGAINPLAEITVEAWIKVPSYSNDYKPIIVKPNVLYFGIAGNTNGLLHFNLGSGAAWYGGANSVHAIPLNTWTHVAASWDYAHQTVSIYINGVVDKTFQVTADPPAFNTDNMIIGREGTYPSFLGSIDEVRIWNRAVPAADILSKKNAELTGLQTGLLAYYNFNVTDNTTTTIVDVSGNASNGILVNASPASWITPGAITSIVIPSQTIVFGSPFTYTIPETAFTGIANADRIFSAKLSNGDPLPSWITFNSTTLTFSGTVPAQSAGAPSFRYNAPAASNANPANLDIILTCSNPVGDIIVYLLNLDVTNVTTYVSEVSNTNIAVYPNPTKGMIQINSTDKIEQLSVMNINGQVLMTKTNVQNNEAVDVSNLSSGVYILRVLSNNKTVNTRLIKQ